MGANVTFKGIEKPQMKLESVKNLDAAKKILSVNTGELNNLMQRNASFAGKYTKGQTKRSITSTIQGSGLSSVTKPGTHYSPYLEYGTRYMSAQSFVRPSFNVQKLIFLSDMRALLR